MHVGASWLLCVFLLPNIRWIIFSLHPTIQQQMKKLKQALGKEDTKKPKNMNLSYTMINDKKGKVSHNPVFVYKSPDKSAAETGLENLVISVVQNSVKNCAVINIDKIVKEIMERCEQNEKFQNIFKEKARLNKTVENEELKKLQEIKYLVEQILEKQQKNNKNDSILIQFHQQLGKVIRNKNKITKKEKLDEYDRLIKMLSPRKNYKNEKKQTPGQSLNNLKVKVTKQEYEIKRESSESNSLRMGSEGKRVKTAGSSHSAFKSENGNEKLKKLLQKQPSLKIIKTKIQYDYSAILEASKSKIQPRSRNMTNANPQKSSAVDITTKLNKAKKNEAFVFYRPKAGCKKE